MRRLVCQRTGEVSGDGAIKVVVAGGAAILEIDQKHIYTPQFDTIDLCSISISNNNSPSLRPFAPTHRSRGPPPRTS